MPESTLFILLIFLHLIGCAALYAGMRLHLIQAKSYMILPALFVPLWGGLCILLVHFLHITRLEGTAEAGLEKLQSNEEVYRSLLVEDLNMQKSVVPLQEALILNDARLRRGMMLDVLYENPGDYYNLLDEAIANEDGEIVHYATTAMAELAKEYDFSLQQLEKEYSAQPDDPGILCRYCDFLGQYLQLNLVQGQMERVQRRQYAQLLSKRLEYEPTLENYHLLASTQIRLLELSQAEATLEEMEKRWPDEEKTLMTRLEYAAYQGDGDGVQAIVDRVKIGEFYLSAEGRRKLHFFAKSNATQTKGQIENEAQTI